MDTLPLRTIKPSQVEAWLSDYYGKLSASAYNAALTLLRDIFNLAVRDRIIAESPAAHLKHKKREKPIRLTPSFEQFRAIVADVRAQHFNADAQDSGDFLEAMGLLGLGQAELAPMTRADVDLAASQIITFRHKTSTGFAVPIFPQAWPLLEGLCEGKASGDRIFKIADAKKALRNACKRLGLPRFSQRSLRRVFVTRAIEKGIDVKVISEWQGHKDGGKLILDTYSHVNRVHSRRMAALMTDDRPGNVIPMANAEVAR
jgi:integrase